jgi:hypothetical protein
VRRVLLLLPLLALVGCSEGTVKALRANPERTQTTFGCGPVTYQGEAIPDTVVALCDKLLTRDGEVALARLKKETK